MWLQLLLTVLEKPWQLTAKAIWGLKYNVMNISDHGLQTFLAQVPVPWIMDGTPSTSLASSAQVLEDWHSQESIGQNQWRT